MIETLGTALAHSLTGLGSMAALATLPGSVELAALTLGALVPADRRRHSGRRLRLAVVVPAHDEAAGIGRCLRSLAACERRWADHDIVVVADNCSDATADIARRHGVTVLERNDPGRRGKGWALAHAFAALAPRRFDGYVVVDADSDVRPNLIDSLARVLDTADAAQAPYGVRNADGSPRTRLMRLALLAFNRLRPQGRARLGASAGILGNGFALRRELVEQVPYDCHSVVEDLEYHIELVLAGKQVGFADDTEVLADMPLDGSAAATQRARWEGGRLRVALDRAPMLLRRVLRGDARAVEPLLDLTLLPLAQHALLLLLALFLAPSWLQATAAAGLGVILMHVFVAARLGGDGIADLAVLLRVPGYVAWKCSRTLATWQASRRDAAWVRTARH